MEIKVSIIMPSLNVGEYIEKCLLSALNNTLEEKEIICIDAGSTDGTLEIINKYANMIEYCDIIRVINSPVKSYGYQVNLGIKEAKGKYIAILETDDYVSENMYESLYNVAEEYNLDVVKADYVRFCKYGNEYTHYVPVRLFADNCGKYNTVISTKYNPYLYVNDYSIWKGIYNADFLKMNNIFFNESFGAAYQDIGFSIQVLSCADRVMYIDKLFYYYRLDRGEASSYSPKALKYCITEYKRIIDNCDIREKIKCWNGVYHRMAGSLISSLGIILASSKYNIAALDFFKEYRWMKSILENNETFNKYLCENSNNTYNMLCEIFSDPICYMQKLCELNLRRQKFIDELRDKKIYVFGCGVIGKELILELYKNKLYNICLTDNNTALWGRDCFNISVRSPQDAVNDFLAYKKNKIFVIANKRYYDSIYNQIVNLGIDVDNIIIYSTIN